MKIKNIFRQWLPFVVVISAFSLLVHASVQQAYRQGANDPQIQMANDAAYALDHGKTIKDIVPVEIIEMDHSLAPFYLIFNSDEQPVAGSGMLNDSLQTLPDSVLDYTKAHGEDRITWQPQPNVRIAAVIVPYADGFVLAGRNMREVEIRESQAGSFAGMTWIFAMIGTFVVIAFGEFFLMDKK